MSEAGRESQPLVEVDFDTLLQIQKGKALPLPEYMNDPKVAGAFLNHMSRLSDAEIINFLEAFIENKHIQKVENIVKNRAFIEEELRRHTRRAAMIGMTTTATAVAFTLAAKNANMTWAYYLGGLIILEMGVYTYGVGVSKRKDDAAIRQIPRISNLLYAVMHKPRN